MYALFYVRRVKDSLYPWDLGYEKNEEWINLLNVFDDIEHKLDEWNKKEKKKDEIEDSNAIPPKKESISEKIEKLGRRGDGDDSSSKKKRDQKDSSSKKIQFEVPWKHSKKTIKDFRKMIGI